MSVRRVALAVALGLSGVAASASADVEVKFDNKTDWSIHHMYLAPTSTEEWGPDQLGDDTIEPGDNFTLKNIPEGKYDFKIVDEDEDECVVANVSVKASETVKLTNDLLVGCQQATAEQADEE